MSDICPTCRPAVSCCDDTIFSYDITGGTIFYSAEASVIYTCDPGPECVPGTYTIPRGRIQMMVDLDGGVSTLSLQCCQSMITQQVPAGSTRAEIAAIAQSMVNACAAQFAECSARSGIQDKTPIIPTPDIPTPVIPTPVIPVTPVIPPADCTDAIAADASIPRYINSTLVTDYHDPVGANIAPYARPNTSGAIPGCGIAPSCGGVGEPACGAWTEPVPSNAFTLMGTVNLSVDKKRGFKNVQAMKWWHGRWGYGSSNWFAPNFLDVSPVSSGPYAKGQIILDCRDYVSSPDETRYRTLNVTASVVVTGDPLGGHGGARTVTATSTMTVARNSGVLTGSASIDREMSVDDTAFIMDLLGNATDNVDSVYGAFATIINNHCLSGDIGGDLTLSITGTQYQWTWAYVGGETIWQITVDASAGTFKDEQWYYDNPTITGSGLNQTGYDLWTVSGVNLTRVNYLNVILDLSPYTQTLTCLGVMSDAYTGADLQSDIQSQLGQWNLADDAQYPWRTDDYTTQAPLVVRHEVQQAVEPTVLTVDGVYTDTNASNFTGELLGAPLSAGYQAFFDFRHRNWLKCGGFTWYIQSFGAIAPCYLPMNATHWTNLFEAHQWARKGAFNIHFPGVRVAQKWAEVREVRPAHNYLRPCGEDIFLIKEDTNRCIVSSAGSPLQVTVSGAPAIITGDLCVATGLGVDDGLFAVTKISADVFELTTFIAPLPAGYTTNGSVFGKSRFPNAWPICGRIAVTNATNSTPILVTLAEGATFLRTGHSVTIAGVGGNTAANGTFVWTRVSDTTGTLDASVGNGAYTSGGNAQSAGAPTNASFDGTSKNNYAVHQWGFNRRDIGEYDRIISAGCIPGFSEPRPGQEANGMDQGVNSFTCSTGTLVPVACTPDVLCISPNGETFTNGAVTAFAVILADDIYGNQWQSIHVQAVDDPLWEAPIKPCGFSGTWSRDSGACQSDTMTDRYYAIPGQVEARCALPAGAPALPAGFYVGWLTLPDYEPAPPILGNKSIPPVPLLTDSSGQPITNPTVWSILTNQEICVCLGGAFSTEYEADGVTCDP